MRRSFKIIKHALGSFTYEDGYEKELENKINAIGKNKNLILILNSPNNPSGTVCNNLHELANVAKKYKILILSDEIYTDLTFSNDYY